MSAIFGLLHLDGRAVATDDLARMKAALSAHGPDGGDTWQQGNVGLGQQLMCFTPEDRFEHQPLVSPDGQRTLVSDARIDNRPELMREFGINQAEASQLPDSAFILRTYEKWGEDCASHLVGDFAFALWDAHKKQLLLACSPMGQRPLYFYKGQNSFVFSTMPKGLFAVPFVPRDIDQESLADFLVLLSATPGKSLYRDMQYVQAGHTLVVRPDGWQQKCYWQLEPNYELHLPRDDEYVEAFGELFQRVVADHQRSLTPVGIMLSGGLDSASVAAAAASSMTAKGQRLAAFTEIPREGFDGAIVPSRYADETPFVRAMASRYENLDLNLVRTDGRFFLDDIKTFFDATEYPFPNVANRIWWETILDKARQQNVRVLLTGTGGNQSMSWSGDGLLSQLLGQGKWLRAIHEARALHQQGVQRSPLYILVSMGLIPWLPDMLYTGIQRLRGIKTTSVLSYSPIQPDFAREQKVLERARVRGVDMPYRVRHDTRRMRCEFFQTAGEGASIPSGNLARFGVDLRHPPFDSRIIKFCISLPEEQYWRDGQSRWLIRRAMADRLPAEILANNKRGLQCADWYERLYMAREQVRDELHRLRQSNLASHALDLDRVDKLVDRMPRPGMESAGAIVEYRSLLNTCLMTGRFLRWFESGE